MSPTVPRASLSAHEEQIVDEVLATGHSALSTLAAIQAVVLRDLIVGKYGAIPPSGINIKKVELTGTLDLDNADVTFPLKFYDCSFVSYSEDGAILARDARLHSLLLRSGDIRGGIAADRATIAQNFSLRECEVLGPVRLPRARVGGNIDFSGERPGGGRPTTFNNPSGAALVLEGTDCQGDLLLDRSEIRARTSIDANKIIIRGSLSIQLADLEGVAVFRNARIEGNFHGEGVKVRGDPVSLQAAGITVEGDVLLSDHNTVFTGAVIFERAAIGGRFAANSATFAGRVLGEDKIALNLEGGRIAGLCSFTEANVRGELRLRAARLGGAFAATRIMITNQVNPALADWSHCALNAEQATVEQDWFMGECAIDGQCILRGARIGGQLRASGVFKNISEGRYFDAIVGQRLGNYHLDITRERTVLEASTGRLGGAHA